MNRTTCLARIHPTGEDGGGCSLDTLGGLVTVERTDEALTPYGGLAAWSAFVGRMGSFERLAERCPVERTSPNAAPVREVLHSFAVTALIEGRRFRHVGWVQDDSGVAAVLGLARDYVQRTVVGTDPQVAAADVQLGPRPADRLDHAVGPRPAVAVGP